MSDITQVKEQLAIVLNNNTTVEGLAEDFNNLYATIGTDETAAALMTSAWDRVQALATTVDQAAALAQVAVEVANEMVTQRDAIADELSTVAEQHRELDEAVRSIDVDHPLVSRMYEGIEEEVWEYVYEVQENGGGLHLDMPGETAVENGHLGDDTLASEIETVVNAILGLNDSLSDELNAELGEFVRNFANKAETYWREERAKRAAEYEARRKAKAAEALANGQ